MKRSIFTVTPCDGGWEVRGPFSEAWFSLLKKNAVKQGRIIARGRQPSQLVIKGRNGRIQTEHTYGNDPERYKG